MQWAQLLRGAGLLVLLALMLWLAFKVRLPELDVIRGWIEGLGWAGFLGFILLYALVALTPIPVTIMALAGGLLYGVLLGSALSVVGALLGCWGAYWIARALGKETVRKLLGDHAARVEAPLEGAGFQAVFMLRVMPGLPYWPVNYGAGVFGINHRDYLLASAIAILPGQVSLIAIGGFISEPNLLNGVIVVVAWLVVLAMTGWGYVTWRDARNAVREESGVIGENSADTLPGEDHPGSRDAQL